MPDYLTSSLDWPDHPLWHDATDYSPDVAQRLQQAYAYLGQSGHSNTQTDVYLGVYAWARNSQGRSMSQRQRMLVHYLLGVAKVNRDGDYDSAIDHFVVASELATQVGDTVAAVKLAHLAGSAARATLRCFDAIELHTYGLNLLRNMTPPLVAGTAAHSLEVDLLLALAGNNFAMSHYAHAQNNIEEARSLAVLLPDRAPSARDAAIDSIDALLLRWQGRTHEALNVALRASDAYSRLATSPAALLTYDRQSAVVAEIALDLAESRLADGRTHDRDQYVALARPHVERATHLAQDVQDLPGLGLAQLARIRYERIAGYAADGRVQAIEDVIKLGRGLNDTAILGQAYTALGHEFASLGKKSQARNRYLKALEAVKNSDVPAMGAWARRALLTQSEMKRN